MENRAEEQQQLQAPEPKAHPNRKKHWRRRRDKSRSGQLQIGGNAPEATQMLASQPSPRNAGSRG